MLSALLRPFKGSSSQPDDNADLEHDFTFQPSVAEYRSHLHATADFTEADDDDEEESNEGEQSRYPRGGRQEDEDGMARSSGLLPLFSANNLDSVPIYSMTHAIRIIIQSRTETSLIWEQLRSPQISQFLIKPMLQQIRGQHFSAGTLYVLMANCLQFEKDGQQYPATAGTSATRARVCEMLAIELLKEYSTRELIDALCHDFYPLQGCPGSQSPFTPGGGRPKSTVPRTSALEVAIRASAKHFLAHPLVVQHLEAIWNGAICFSTPAEERESPGSATSAAGSNLSRRQSTVRTPLLGEQRSKTEPAQPKSAPGDQRSVTLYNPRTATLFKLSRLRVPRYRRLLSTGSLIVLVCLFLAVLGERSSRITSLELLFWFWSAGFMLDELVGFSEQGFSFYVMSFWNVFDLGILLLLIVYYCMRIYGVFLLDPHKWNQNAYDVLAVNAILLLPRIFGVLEHYRYFSRLLISLRLLAVDLAALFVLVFICCGGFFVFFAFSKTPDNASTVAYKMFQILMGSTASAWEMWSSYNWMGKTLLALFLVVGHFIILTMLITVLTNSFMSIASRANAEYQFTFAINTISMAKNDSLFSYIAPGNIFAWALMPLQYCMSKTQYVRVNRAIIKVTHFPLLFCIYFYEKCFLAPGMYESTDLVDKPRRARHHTYSDPASRSAFFSPSIRIREESVLGYQRDRALEEVFRRVPESRNQRRNDRRKSQTAIRSWMEQHEPSPQQYPTIDSRMGSDWQRNLEMNRERPSRVPRHYSDIRSTASDPADFIQDAPYPMAAAMYDYQDGVARRDYAFEVKDNTDGDADGDDELVTNDEDEGDDATNNMDDRGLARDEAIVEDYFTTPVATRFTNAELAPDSPRPQTSRRVPLHTRTLSTNTILYAPEENRPYSSSSASAWPVSRPFSRPISTRHTPVATPVTPGVTRRSPRRTMYLASSRPRSMIQPGESISRTASSRTGGLTLDIPNSDATNPEMSQPPPRRRSLTDLHSTSIADESHTLSSPNYRPSKVTRNLSSQGHSSGGASGSSDVNKLMLARMKHLEDNLGYMVREMRTLRKSVPNTAYNSDEGGGEGRSKVSPNWGRSHYRQHHSHGRGGGGLQVGSDPSSTATMATTAAAARGQALIEVAVGAQGRDRERDRDRDRERERERERGGVGGLRRARTSTGPSSSQVPSSFSGMGGGGAVPRRVLPGRRPLGVWRSSAVDVAEEGRAAAAAAAGLGIAGRSGLGVGVGGSAEEGVVGKGKGREINGSLKSAMSPADDELDVGGKGLSL